MVLDLRAINTNLIITQSYLGKGRMEQLKTVATELSKLQTRIFRKECFEVYHKTNDIIEMNIDDAEIPKKYRGLTFDDYIVKSDNQKVSKQAALDFTNNAFGVGLIMCGRNGTGKSMLCSIILQEIIRRNPDQSHSSGYTYFNHTKRLYTEAIKLVRVIKTSWRPGSKYTEQDAIDYFVRPSVLVIDEVGVQYGTPTEAQFITEIINDRYNQQRPTILCGNMTLKEISVLIGERAIDRFRESGKALVFDWPSFRGKT